MVVLTRGHLEAGAVEIAGLILIGAAGLLVLSRLWQA
jgi:hypothetical protein